MYNGWILLAEPRCVAFANLINVPKHIRPTGLDGHGRPHRVTIPNQHLTSPETVRYITEAEDRTEKKDKLKKEEEMFYKKALAEKAKKSKDAEKEKMICLIYNDQILIWNLFWNYFIVHYGVYSQCKICFCNVLVWVHTPVGFWHPWCQN